MKLNGIVESDETTNILGPGSPHKQIRRTTERLPQMAQTPVGEKYTDLETIPTLSTEELLAKLETLDHKKYRSAQSKYRNYLINVVWDLMK